MLLITILKSCLSTRYLFLLILILGFLTEFNCQQEIVQDEDNEMNDINDDESSGHFQEEDNNNNKNNLVKNENVNKQSQPVLTQNNQFQNKNENIQKDAEESHFDISPENNNHDDVNNNINNNSLEDKEDDFDNEQETLDTQKDNNDYDSIDGDLDKTPIESNQKVQVPYQGRAKLLSIITKPGILAGIVGGAIIGVLTAILLIMFIVYRMRKKDEGSYALEETKKPLNAYDYRHCPTKEFYA